MPSRIIRESCLTSDTLLVLTGDEDRLWWRLTILADDHGRFDADPATLASRAFPRVRTLPAERLEEWLQWITRTGGVAIYEVEGRRFGVFPKWAKHQRPRQTRPKYPDPPAEALEAALKRDEALRRYLRQPAADGRKWRQFAAPAAARRKLRPGVWGMGYGGKAKRSPPPPSPSPPTALAVPSEGGTAAVVDAYLAIGGLTGAQKRAVGGFLAGLVKRYGQATVLRAIADEGPAIASADNPRLYLAAVCRGMHRRGPPRTLEERKREVIQNLGGAP